MAAAAHFSYGNCFIKSFDVKSSELLQDNSFIDDVLHSVPYIVAFVMS